MMPNLKPSTKTISLRLSVDLLDNIKIETNKLDQYIDRASYSIVLRIL